MAAQRAASDRLGYMHPPERGMNDLPGEGPAVGGNGDIAVVPYDFFRTSDWIDPDDLRSWADDLQQFSEPAARTRLESAFTERYNED